MRRHVIAASDFLDLARAGGSAQTIGFLKASQLSLRTVTLKLIADAARVRLATDQRQRFESAMAAMVAAGERSRSAIHTVLLDPMTGAWLAQCLSRLHAPGRSGADGPTDHADDLGYFAALAVSAAVQAGTFAEVDVKVPGRRLLLPGTGYLELDSGRETTAASASRWFRVRAEGGRASVHDLNGSPVTTRQRAARRIAVVTGSSPLDLRIEEHDPYRDIASTNLPAAMDDAEHRRWCNTFAEAWKLLSAYHPAQAAAVSVGLSCVVPLRAEPGTPPQSATAEATFGATSLVLPDDATALAALLVHEFQHTKLFALHHVIPLTTSARGELIQVAWRPDPRPVDAALQGAYAHLALIEFWYRQTEADWSSDRDPTVEFLWAREAVRLALADVSRSGSLTRAGAWFVAEMRGIVERWRKVPVVTTANLPRSFA